MPTKGIFLGEDEWKVLIDAMVERAIDKYTRGGTKPPPKERRIVKLIAHRINYELPTEY